MMVSSSCKKDKTVSDDSGSDAPVKVQFKSSIDNVTPHTKAFGATWDAGDGIGVFMVNHGTAVVNGDAVNKHYVTASGGLSGTFEVTSPADDIFYPANTGKADFIAYYPYKAGIATLACPVTVADQSNPAAIDLLYANTLQTFSAGYDKSNTSPINLYFTHKLSKIVINVTSDDLSVSELADASVNILGTKTAASFDLATGTLNSPGSVAAITPHTVTAGVKYDAILLPGAFATGEIILSFTVPFTGKTYTWNVPAVVFDAAKEYVYTVSIVDGVLVGTLNSEIADWLTVTFPSDDATQVTHNMEISTWTVTASSSYMDDKAPELMLDGNINTFWHSSADGTLAESWPPHVILIDMKKIRMISGIKVWARQDGAIHSQPKIMLFEVSYDQATWATLISLPGDGSPREYEQDANALPKTVINPGTELPYGDPNADLAVAVPAAGRYLRITIEDMWDGWKGIFYTNLAEITPY
jgi:hypothetical protein